MRESFSYAGRHVASDETEPDLITPNPGQVLALVERIKEFEVVHLYAQQAVINRWGIRLINPFHRLSDLRGDYYAEYFDEDFHLFCPARIEIVDAEYWMFREI